MRTVRIAWWVLGIYFLVEAVAEHGMIAGALHFLNPLTPP